MSTRLILAGSLATAVYLISPSTGFYLLIAGSGVAAIFLGVHVNRPLKPLSWWLMGTGSAFWVTGDLFYDVPGLVPATEHASDLAYLAAYPLLAAGLAVLVRAGRPARDLAGLVDSLIVTTGCFLLSWVLVADPIVDDNGVPWLDRAIAVAYPLGDIVLLALLVRLVAAPGTRSPAFRLLVTATLLLLVADTVFAVQVGSDYTTALDGLWLMSYVLWGAAALHPTMSQLSTPTALRAAPFSGRRLAALTAAVLIAPALVIVQMTRGLHIDTWTIVLGASTLSMLVVLRMACNIEEIRSTARQRDELQSDLFHQAAHDPLTGLANNPYMRQLIGAALRRGHRDGTSVGLLLVDIDDFDEVNDRHGHGVGDEVLRTLGARLESLVREVDAVGRLGGDQLVVLIDSVASDHDAMIIAARLLPQLTQPVTVGGRTITVSASIGAATSMDGGTDADDLLHEASVAIRRAKAAGRGRVEVFDSRLRDELGERSEVEAALTAALENDELEVHYFPVVAVQTEFVDGYEAQLRWNRPGHGLQDPTTFLEIAASSDLVCRIDRWVLGQATAELAALSAENPARCGELTVAVSISARMLASPSLLDDVQAALERAGLAPHRLTIGVTEMALVDVPNAVLPLSSLRHAGVFVSINDFGTGRTPLAQLPHLPADAIKVDPSMLGPTDRGELDLLALLVNAAHSNGLLIVAEGVEHAEQLAQLRLLECDSAQGIYSASLDPAIALIPSPPAPPGEPPRLRVVTDET